jgi:hypothetical protein
MKKKKLKDIEIGLEDIIMIQLIKIIDPGTKSVDIKLLSRLKLTELKIKMKKL